MYKHNIMVYKLHKELKIKQRMPKKVNYSSIVANSTSCLTCINCPTPAARVIFSVLQRM